MRSGPQIGTKDVARRAGVSPATVSRVLTGATAVAEAKREAVLAACRELGFVPNGAARALSSRRSMAIGAVVPNVANDAFAIAMSAFQDRLKLANYTLLLTAAGYDVDAELREVERLLQSGVDGLMLVGGVHHAHVYERIDRLGVPFVQTWTLSETRACVGFDNTEAGRRAGSYLLDLGHRSIGVITGPRENNDRAPARVDGVRRAMEERGLSLPGEQDLDRAIGIGGGRDAMREMLSRIPRPTAVVCGNDQLAFGAMIEAQAQGFSVPGDMSVIGFNDSDFAAHLSPSLTTIRVPMDAIGRVSADYLLNTLLDRPVIRRTEVAAELVVRGSTAPPAARP